MKSRVVRIDKVFSKTFKAKAGNDGVITTEDSIPIDVGITVSGKISKLVLHVQKPDGDKKHKTSVLFKYDGKLFYKKECSIDESKTKTLTINKELTVKDGKMVFWNVTSEGFKPNESVVVDVTIYVTQIGLG
jgi:hypothetical protein